MHLQLGDPHRQANERMARGHMIYRSAYQPVLLILLSVLQLAHTQSEYTDIKYIEKKRLNPLKLRMIAGSLCEIFFFPTSAKDKGTL